MTEEEIKAYRLADNRTGEVATWNKTLLQREVKSLGEFDMQRFKFDFKMKKAKAQQKKYQRISKKQQ